MLTDLTDIDKTAQAKVGTETWTVKSDKAPLLKGTKVKVLAIEGVKLIVEPVTEWEVNKGNIAELEIINNNYLFNIFNIWAIGLFFYA